MRYKYQAASFIMTYSRLRLLMVNLVLLLSFFGLSLKGQNVTRSYATSSQLSSGAWTRIAVDASGICRLSYQDLLNMQIPVAGIESSAIRIHGFGGMLPENAGAPRYDDLPEVAVQMFDGGDNRFDPGDYLVFYSSGPHAWRYNNQASAFEHIVNIYSDQAYYYITVGNTPGLRVQQMQQPVNAAQEVRFYDHRDVISPELYNLIKSGRGWYGDFFDIITQRDYNFTPVSLRQGSDLKLRFSVVARSSFGCSFTLAVAGNNYTLPVSSVSNDFNTNYAHISTNRFVQPAPADFSSASVVFNKSSGMDIGWLNFIEVNAEARLRYTGQQLPFRKVGLEGEVEYLIEGASDDMFVWEITDPLRPRFINANNQGGILRFKATADTLHEYIIASGSNMITPVLIGQVGNQNLHGMSTPQMLIIAPPEFMNEAVRLATFHGQHDDLSVSVVTPQSIYNEFSSGSQDISAIRNFIKMLWHKAEPANLPRYVLLFGDASYDFKNRVPANTNIIPTYQSPESLHPVHSLATDDFFVCIDDNEGGNSNDGVDIGIGRLPVKNSQEATMAVDKILNYVTATDKVHGDWRNIISFVADDGDGNIHMDQANQIAQMIDTVFSNYNTDKIFLDAYVQESMAGGQRSPDANTAINQRVNKGALIINYTGHGGETGWTKEQILEVKDITDWTNYDRLPVFMTATCEFSRYDDPLRVSGGEHAFLNPKGGAIALFTTARPTYGTPNFELAKNFYRTALQPMNGTMPRLGDIIRIAKAQSGSDNNTKKFVLLGDPAMTMAYPELEVLTTSINGVTVSEKADTISALEEVIIRGVISDKNGQTVSDFNGMIMTTVYDKESNIETFGTQESGVMSFTLRKNIIHKGRAEVINGEFNLSLIVPRDIAYQYGPGKISYYATNGTTDAAGHYKNLIVGGIGGNLNDHEGPEVTLYINDSSFKAGGFTDPNPVLLAYIKDHSGINTIGNSIGHDIVAILDNNTQHPYILNDYYQADMNTYKSGSLMFPFFNLAPGSHTVSLRIWDVNNNSSEITTHFVVAPDNQLVLNEIEAWPNPMINEIDFAIGHNQAGRELKAELSVYNLSGNKVATIKRNIFAGGYRTSLFRWNGEGTSGSLLSSGFYIAKLRIETPEGLVSDKSIKIIIAR